MRSAPGADARAYALENGFLLLLNKDHSVDESYKAADMVQLDEAICCPDRPVETHLLRKEAADQFAKLIAERMGVEVLGGLDDLEG